MDTILIDAATSKPRPILALPVERCKTHVVFYRELRPGEFITLWGMRCAVQVESIFQCMPGRYLRGDGTERTETPFDWWMICRTVQGSAFPVTRLITEYVNVVHGVDNATDKDTADAFERIRAALA